MQCGPRIEIDPAGTAYYYIDNQTPYSIDVVMYFVPQLGSGTEEIFIGPHAALQIFSDTIIGVNPLPSHTFTMIEIFNSDDDTLLYTQNPIDNSLCDMEILTRGDYYCANHVFTLDDQD
jgi:hypothetical protein